MAKNKQVCFYFQVHQPYRLSDFKFFDIEQRKKYFGASNKRYFNKVADKCYIPANKLLLKLIDKHPKFKIAYSLSGVFLEQAQEFNPPVLKLFQDLVATKKVELLSETYYHSLASLYSYKEFAEQVNMHRQLIWKLFKKKPQVFRNTELIYNDNIAEFVRRMGFKAMLAEGWEDVLDGKSPNFVYSSHKAKLLQPDKQTAQDYEFMSKENKLSVLLKNYKLSDDIAFRFSDKKWSEYPLSAEKFADWVLLVEGSVINLFMDYETFGEHQWEDSGIFKFLQDLPVAFEERGIAFITPSEVCRKFAPEQSVSFEQSVSWADTERDLSAWLGNKMQVEAVRQIYACIRDITYLEQANFRIKDTKQLLEKWRKLQTSDHFYYMSTKYWNDGDIHKYFSPYESPYDAYINYMNVLQDFKRHLAKLVDALDITQLAKPR